MSKTNLAEKWAQSTQKTQIEKKNTKPPNRQSVKQLVNIFESKPPIDTAKEISDKQKFQRRKTFQPINQSILERKETEKIKVGKIMEDNYFIKVDKGRFEKKDAEVKNEIRKSASQKMEIPFKDITRSINSPSQQLDPNKCPNSEVIKNIDQKLGSSRRISLQELKQPPGRSSNVSNRNSARTSQTTPRKASLVQQQKVDTKLLQNPFIQNEIKRLQADEIQGESALLSRRLAMESTGKHSSGNKERLNQSQPLVIKISQISADSKNAMQASPFELSRTLEMQKNLSEINGTEKIQNEESSTQNESQVTKEMPKLPQNQIQQPPLELNKQCSNPYVPIPRGIEPYNKIKMQKQNKAKQPLLQQIFGDFKQEVLKMYGSPKDQQQKEQQQLSIKEKISEQNLNALQSQKRSIIRKYEKQMTNVNIKANRASQKLIFKFVKNKFTTSSTNRYVQKDKKYKIQKYGKESSGKKTKSNSVEYNQSSNNSSGRKRRASVSVPYKIFDGRIILYEEQN